MARNQQQKDAAAARKQQRQERKRNGRKRTQATANGYKRMGREHYLPGSGS